MPENNVYIAPKHYTAPNSFIYSAPYDPNSVTTLDIEYLPFETKDAISPFVAAVAYSGTKMVLKGKLSEKYTEIFAGAAYGAAMFAITRNPTSIIFPVINTVVNYITANSIENENNKSPEQRKKDAKAADRRSKHNQDVGAALPLYPSNDVINTISNPSGSPEDIRVKAPQPKNNKSARTDGLFSYLPNPGQVTGVVLDGVINNKDPLFLIPTALIDNYAGYKFGNGVGYGINSVFRTIGKWTGLISQEEQKAPLIGLGDSVKNPLYEGRKI
jgi:hypothetical protein